MREFALLSVAESQQLCYSTEADGHVELFGGVVACMTLGEPCGTGRGANLVCGPYEGNAVLIYSRTLMWRPGAQQRIDAVCMASCAIHVDDAYVANRLPALRSPDLAASCNTTTQQSHSVYCTMHVSLLA